MKCSLRAQRLLNGMLGISGFCDAPTPGYKLELEAGNEGTPPVPGYVSLQLNASPPSEVVPEVLTSTPLIYVGELDDNKTHVRVHGVDGDILPIDNERGFEIDGGSATECSLRAQRLVDGSLAIWGTCGAPTPGYALELGPANGRINPDPDHVYFELKATPPESGPVVDVITDTELVYIGPLDDDETTVTIFGMIPQEILIE